MRIALATSSEFPDLYSDDQHLRAALRALGADAGPAVWDDPGQDWAAYDLVVVRSTWDYVPRHAAFVAWARSVPRLANPAAVVAWNIDKTYLRGLAEAGLPVVPTAWVGAPASLAAVCESPGWGDVVVKPTVSAGARDTLRCAAASAEGQALLDRIVAGGRTAMVQPYLASVEEYGERSLLFAAGELTHAVRRNPALSLEGESRYDARLVDATEEEVSLAKAVLAEVAEVPGAGPEPLLYARVDLVRDERGEPLLIELEVIEPQLFLRYSDPATRALAAATVARAGSAGSSTTNGS
jgi:glutathione synthase/RimK-type ligase-like ATP-grasp enzyme